ncbi:quinone oxidoreductase family protein [Nocardia mikamii]|uniref:quinone oxidoreductase family protein n=1 Tax=Nocardia mikamii TaxID=508464 RepID=UPI0007A512B2|nr:NADP-dependent oxidoreductase [Nocardia mikamii]
MKAVGVTEFGGPEVLRILELPVPEPGPGEILIRVHAASVNPVDALVRQGKEFVFDANPPYVPGMDAAGVVERIGNEVNTGVRPGDRVMAIAVVSGTHGAYAEYLVVPAESAVAIPAGCTDAEAATLPMCGLTARMGLDALALERGATVAVTGAAGAVGGYAVQLAKADGLRVIADATDADQQLVRDLGADIVVPRGRRFGDHVRRHIAAGAHGLFDAAGIADTASAAVRDNGVVASSVPDAHAPDERGLVSHNLFVPDYAREHAELDRLRRQVDEGRITLRVARRLPYGRASEAHRLLDAGGIRGRIVLTF